MLLRVVLEKAERRRVHVLRLSDGKTLAAVEQRSAMASCVPLGHAAGTPLIVPFFEASRGLFLGRVDLTQPEIRWSRQWVKTPGIPTSTFDPGRGMGATFDDGTVAILEPSASSWRVLERGATSYRSDATESATVWSRTGALGRDVIRGQLAEGAPVMLVEHEADAHVVALSTTHMVWIGTTGVRARAGEYERAQVFFSDPPRPSAPVRVEAGPVLPATSDLLDLVTAGDQAATIGCRKDACELFVVSLRSGKVTRRFPSPGASFRGVLAISATEVLVAEARADAPPQRIDAFLRLAISKR